MKSYLSKKTAIRKSLIHGYGLFARTSMKKDELIAVKGGHIFDIALLRKIEDGIEDSYIQIENNLFIGAIHKFEVSDNKLFLNHSCEPNVGIRGQITFVAMRDIRAGEELTYDWAMENDEAGIPGEYKCNCNKSNCRKLITGKDWKRKDLQEKYKGYFSAYIQRKIEGKNV
jgi:SET domain-containing protein